MENFEKKNNFWKDDEKTLEKQHTFSKLHSNKNLHFDALSQNSNQHLVKRNQTQIDPAALFLTVHQQQVIK